MSATAFVPGAVSGFFSVHPHDDPERAGARGAGLALSDGVRATVTAADERALTLDGDPVEMGAFDRVLDALDVRAAADVETPLPVGAGFGVSGGVALGTALASNAAFDLGYSRRELVGAAHAAEVRAGTGLGDVVGQARGGVPVVAEPGAPPHGTVDAIPGAGRVEYVSFGSLATAEVVGGDTAGISEAGERALAALREAPTLERLFAVSRTFAEEADLLAPRVADAVEAVTDAGGEAAMAMLGESVVALGDGLSAAGYDAAACEIDAAGARLVE